MSGTLEGIRDALEVHEESLARAHTETLALLEATRRRSVCEARFDWLYRNNPDGPAVLWTLRRRSNGELAGFTAALPRRMRVDGKLYTCWNGADFSMHPRYRTLGPAIKLRRAARDAVDAGQADFLYAHPNERMAAVHARVGHREVGRMVRYAKPLKSALFLQERLGNRAAAAVLGIAADGLLRVTARELRHRPSIQVQLVSPARFDDRFDQLFERSASSSRVIGVRDARYLAWRYTENPLYETHLLAAESEGQLRGYLLFTVDDHRVGHIKDVFPPGDAAVLRDLVVAAIREGRKQGLKSLSFVALECHPLLSIIPGFGFRLRPGQSRMFAYGPPESALRTILPQPQSWFLAVGDRDI